MTAKDLKILLFWALVLGHSVRTYATDAACALEACAPKPMIEKAYPNWSYQHDDNVIGPDLLPAPEFFEQQDNGDVDSVAEDFVKPEMGPGEFSIPAAHAANFLRELTHDHHLGEGLKNLSNEFKPTTHRDAVMKVAAFSQDDKQAPPALKITEHIRSSSKKKVQKDAKKKIKLKELIGDGIRIKWNFKGLFSSGGGTTAAAHRPEPYRYALKLEKITLATDAPEQFAAVGAFTPEDLEFAHQAKLDWSVEPKGPGDGKYHRQAALPGMDITHPAAPQGDQPSYWDRLSFPEPVFEAKVAPESINLEAESKTAPPVKVTIEQVEGLYTLTYKTAPGGKKESLKHLFRAPIYKNFKVEKLYDEDFGPEKTSLINVLARDGAATVNIHKLEKEERFQGDMSYGWERQSISFKADTPKGWNATRNFATSEGERYEFGYNRDF